jgi:hypothetical protein
MKSYTLLKMIFPWPCINAGHSPLKCVCKSPYVKRYYNQHNYVNCDVSFNELVSFYTRAKRLFFDKGAI